jgi:hypothetical protein
MKSKRRQSEGKKKANVSVHQSNGTPTPESMMYDQSTNYAKYKEYKKYFSSVNPALEDYSSFNRKISHKVGSSGNYGSQLSGSSKSRIESEK